MRASGCLISDVLLAGLLFLKLFLIRSNAGWGVVFGKTGKDEWMHRRMDGWVDDQFRGL